MTREETIKILTLMQAEYPNSFVKLDEQGMKLKCDLWASEFRNDPFEAVYTALRMYMETGAEFAPNIGQVRKRMRSATTEPELSDSDAWSLVSKACCNGYYGYKKEFDKLPPLVQKAVGRPEQLREWSIVNEETFHTVIQSNFKKSYRAVAERQEEISSYPPALMDMINKLQIGMGRMDALPEGEENDS